MTTTTAQPIFTKPAVETGEPNKPRSQIQIARNLKLVNVTHSGSSWGARVRNEVWTVGTDEFLGGIRDAGMGVGGHDPLPLLAQAAREMWPEHV